MGIIYFYRERDLPYGCFSNFSKHDFVLDDLRWRTVEHYFQALKFPGDPHADRIRLVKSPMEAKTLGNDRHAPLRPDWEQVKDDVMRRAVRAKFQTHADIRAVLLGTGDRRIVENAKNDYYWGIGADGSGKNMLGRILMEVRAELRG
jgi:ribA/ribD-fused uncharacterized protein